MKKLKEGMTVYLIPYHTTPLRRLVWSKIKSAEVTKVGRKYFYLRGHMGKFSIDGLMDVSEYSSRWSVYLSKQDVEDAVEWHRMSWKIYDFFKYTGMSKLSLTQLREIDKIISQTKE